MELIFEHPWWTTIWLIIVFGSIGNIKIGGSDYHRKNTSN